MILGTRFPLTSWFAWGWIGRVNIEKKMLLYAFLSKMRKDGDLLVVEFSRA